LIIHTTDELPAHLEAQLEAVVDQPKRGLTARNHTATHLLHAALKEFLGSHVDQKGSLVRSDYLRFDFSHYAKVEPEQLRQIEQRVNEKIREDIPLEEQRSIPIQEALNQGATALFGEKYGEYVRMVTFDPDFSRELCGGTHVPRTGTIGMLKITTETAVAAGIRRIEAVTGPTAEQYIDHRLDQLQAINGMLNNPKDPVQQVQKLQEHHKALQKTIQHYEQMQVQQKRDELLAKASTTEAGYPLICEEVSLSNKDMGKDLTTALQHKDPHAIVLLGARLEGKANLWLALPKALTDKGWDASQMIRPLAEHIQGGGGGKAHFANAGGKEPDGLAIALKEGQSTLEEALQTFTEH
jgi:alanyl-tRNA synthetase